MLTPGQTRSTRYQQYRMFKSPRFKFVLAFLLGVLLSAGWYHYHTPLRPLYVDLYNGTGTTLPEVAITHGKANLQEHIQALQIKPGEHRLLALNHDPGLGFNVDAFLADGRKFSICAGKNNSAYIRVTITSGGLIPSPLR